MAWLVAIAADAVQIGRLAAFCPGRLVSGGCSTRRRCSRHSDPVAGMALGVLADVGGRTDSWVRSVSYLDGGRVLCDPPASSPWGTRNSTSRTGAGSSAVAGQSFLSPFRAGSTAFSPRLAPGAAFLRRFAATCPRSASIEVILWDLEGGLYLELPCSTARSLPAENPPQNETPQDSVKSWGIR